eukprot:TRINITY_DN112396_c0_g1_i1.p1 TRINITY_DN112396_c0_g1~~TRINITY_DN112396_c0_g1_i1.p1  ORF type:complete len:217 (+),score=23.89 TRINITY_DN112396_c0_g1_i1:90-653(+)
MVLRWTQSVFSEVYAPTVGDAYTKDVEIGGAPRHVVIDDTAGQEAYRDLAREKLSTGDVYLLVYSITDDTTFTKLPRLVHEIRAVHPSRDHTPIFFIGTKLDLEGDRAVAASELKALASEHSVSGYFECSSKEGKNVREIFTSAVQEVLKNSTDPQKGGGGGSVMGAGLKPAAMPAPPAKKSRCAIL